MVMTKSPSESGLETRRFEAVYKIVGLGDEGVGKTEILAAVRTGTFEPNTHRATGIDVSMFDTQINNHLIKLLIYNLADHPDFRELHALYCQGASGGLLFIDWTKPTPLDTIPYWVNAFRKGVGSDPPLYLLGTNADPTKHRQVQLKEAEEIIEQFNLAAYYPIPANHPETIAKILNTLTKQIHQKKR